MPLRKTSYGCKEVCRTGLIKSEFHTVKALQVLRMELYLSIFQIVLLSCALDMSYIDYIAKHQL